MTAVFTEQIFHSIFLPNNEFSKKRNAVTLKSVKQETDIVTKDIIDVFVRKNTSHPPPDKVCEAVRWIVRELLDRSNDSVMPLVKQLALSGSVDDERVVISQVLGTVFDDRQVNWGRIGVTYVFGLRLAEGYRRKEMGDRDIEIILAVSDYIKGQLASWIVDQGGWESVRHHFSDEKELVTKIKSASVLLLTIGVTALSAALL